MFNDWYTCLRRVEHTGETIYELKCLGEKLIASLSAFEDAFGDLTDVRCCTPPV
jgi:hypothetical protein